jgi:hypothetical protein
MAVGLLIGAALWLIQNWEQVRTFFSNLWQSILAGYMAFYGPLLQAIGILVTNIKDFFVNLIPQALEWGATLIRTFVDGILSMKSYLVDGVTSVFNAVRRLMPFSDAKEGPFSQLTYSGSRIITTMAEGVAGSASTLHNAMSTAFAQAPTLEANTTTLSAATAPGGIPITPVTAPGTGSRTINISQLIGSLTITGTDKDAKQLADEVIEILHDRLQGADDIMSDGMGALL